MSQALIARFPRTLEPSLAVAIDDE